MENIYHESITSCSTCGSINVSEVINGIYCYNCDEEGDFTEYEEKEEKDEYEDQDEDY